jgi:hypothetical protein
LAPSNTLSSQFLGDSKKKKELAVDFKRKIPMSDCIMANIDQDGNFNGFKVRHEMAKILFWREPTNLK